MPTHLLKFALSSSAATAAAVPSSGRRCCEVDNSLDEMNIIRMSLSMIVVTGERRSTRALAVTHVCFTALLSISHIIRS